MRTAGVFLLFITATCSAAAPEDPAGLWVRRAAEAARLIPDEKERLPSLKMVAALQVGMGDHQAARQTAAGLGDPFRQVIEGSILAQRYVADPQGAIRTALALPKGEARKSALSANSKGSGVFDYMASSKTPDPFEPSIQGTGRTGS